MHSAICKSELGNSFRDCPVEVIELASQQCPSLFWRLVVGGYEGTSYGFNMDA